MNYLKIDGTDDTPEIMIDSDLSLFIISGCSTPEDALATYKPIIDWLSAPDCELDNCQCKFCFKYLSSASHHMVFNIMKKLNNMYDIGRNLSIEWGYEATDEDMLRLGLDFASILTLPFEFCPKTIN